MGNVREETWVDKSGSVVRYNLAFICKSLYAGDNGRVLGYDTAHGQVHRHFAGQVEPIEPAPYEEVFDRFLTEINELRYRRSL